MIRGRCELRHRFVGVAKNGRWDGGWGEEREEWQVVRNCISAPGMAFDVRNGIWHGWQGEWHYGRKPIWHRIM